jgi:hypothetical protein
MRTLRTRSLLGTQHPQLSTSQSIGFVERSGHGSQGIELTVSEGAHKWGNGPRIGDAGERGRRVQDARRAPLVAPILER